MARKGLMEGLPENLPELEEPCPICPLTKATKIPRGSTIDVSKFSPRFMLQMYFLFFNVESISGFTSNFVDVCSTTSYTFVLKSRSKFPTLNIFKLIVTTFINQNNKVSFIQVGEYGSLEISS